MKTKKNSKKLVFNKETISNLYNSEMSGVYGGLSDICPTNVTCEGCDTLADCQYTELCEPTMKGYTCLYPQTGCEIICELP